MTTTHSHNPPISSRVGAADRMPEPGVLSMLGVRRPWTGQTARRLACRASMASSVPARCDAHWVASWACENAPCRRHKHRLVQSVWAACPLCHTEIRQFSSSRGVGCVALKQSEHSRGFVLIGSPLPLKMLGCPDAQMLGRITRLVLGSWGRPGVVRALWTHMGERGNETVAGCRIGFHSFARICHCWPSMPPLLALSAMPARNRAARCGPDPPRARRPRGRQNQAAATAVRGLGVSRLLSRPMGSCCWREQGSRWGAGNVQVRESVLQKPPVVILS